MVATKATAMPRPTSVMLSRCCMTWMRPRIAPMMPMVGENPPAASNTCTTFSACSEWLPISTSMLLRSSLAWVPSTASIMALRRKGASMVSRSLSSETMPSLRALWAKPTICSTKALKSGSVNRNTILASLKARTTTSRGNCSMIAPRVPPKTIRAAVGWRIWARLPPSIISPVTMPPMATSNPIELRRSTLASAAVWHDNHRPPAQGLGRQLAPVLADAPQDLVGLLLDRQFFPVAQRHHGVLGLLDELDQVGVEDQALMVQAGEGNHGRSEPLSALAEKGFTQDGGTGARD